MRQTVLTRTGSLPGAARYPPPCPSFEKFRDFLDQVAPEDFTGGSE
jgi:hypothetical protein